MTVAVPRQDEIEVFVNKDDSITIQQYNPTSQESGLVVVLPQNVAALVRALRATLREQKEPQGHGD